MKRSHFAMALSLALWSAVVPPAVAQNASEPLTEGDAHAIGVDAYLYFYPLVTMELTRRQLTNMEPSSGIGGPANTFANVPAYPTADMRVVVRPNFDTLYSTAWLDLTTEPMIVSVPDTNGRYYLLPMLDMWTDVFASPGWRTTGTEAASFLVVPPGWSGDRSNLPANVSRIDAPTPYVWIIGRIQTNGPQDYDAVHQIQSGLTITPLSQWGRTPAPVAAAPIDPSIDMTTPPKVQVDQMPAATFFSTAAEILRVQNPHLTDQPIIARMKRIGIEPGQSFDLNAAPDLVQRALETVPQAGQTLMRWRGSRLDRVVNGWLMNTSVMGVYGNEYLKRAIVAQLGLGANLPEDAIYPLNLTDDSGNPLDGAHKYTIHFPRGATPPANAFWSITLYDPDGFPVPNPQNRFALSSWMPISYNPDGSLDLHVQTESPGADKEANWLPAPPGSFTLTMRLYSPRSEALTGKWHPPPVTKSDTPPVLGR